MTCSILTNCARGFWTVNEDCILNTDTSISPLYVGEEVVLYRINFYIFESSRMLSRSILKPSHNVFV